MTEEPKTSRADKRGLRLLLIIFHVAVGFVLGMLITGTVVGFFIRNAVLIILTHPGGETVASILIAVNYALMWVGGILGAVVSIKSSK